MISPDPHTGIGVTYYLGVIGNPPEQIFLSDQDPPAFLSDNGVAGRRIRYSPVFPAYVMPGVDVPPPPESTSLGFLFCLNPYWSLGTLKPELEESEYDAVFFSEGLASVMVVGVDEDRLRALAEVTAAVAWELWDSDRDGPVGVSYDFCVSEPEGGWIPAPQVRQRPESPELQTYVEQINASALVLSPFYQRYAPQELETLDAIVELTEELCDRYEEIERAVEALEDGQWPHWAHLEKGRNSINSALVELAAALSYVMTQGATGGPPILSNPGPFPHHSLLGVGTAMRAITNFARYIEEAFAERSTAAVVGDGYSERRDRVPSEIPEYSSGDEYLLAGMGMGRIPDQEGEGGSEPEPELSPVESQERFDRGGGHLDENRVPLICHFSLRHGFKESKFSVTAASESLSAESEPQWTLLTLSHEVMHSAVRGIFQALLGSEWDQPIFELNDELVRQFTEWLESDGENCPSTQIGLRNAVLNFCLTMARSEAVLASPPPSDQNRVSASDLSKAYCDYRQLAIELFAHFHDYYFVYGGQPRVYALSLWASWTRVAAPLAKPEQYLIRTLATLSCGSGSDPRKVFDRARELLEDVFSELELIGVTSPLYSQLRKLCEEEEDTVRERFKPAYYLMDQIRLFFASRTISEKIDGIAGDPHAVTSTIEEYTATVFNFADEPEERISPTRYVLSSFWNSLHQSFGEVDRQWLTARNLMVVSSWRRNENPV